jgi:hypothetical protein
VSTDDVIAQGLGFDLSLGKILLPKIMEALHENGHAVGNLIVPSDALRDDVLTAFN